MPRFIQSSNKAQGKVIHSLGATEYKATVINGFPGQDRTTGEIYYKSLLNYFKTTQRFTGMTWAKANRKWIEEQVDGI